MLILKKRYRVVPWFSFLIGQDLIQSVLLFVVRNHPRTNFYAYWLYEAFDACLRTMVVWEVARILIQQHLGLNFWEEIKGYWLALLAVGAISVSLITFTSTNPYFAIRFALRINQVSTVGVGALVLMLLSMPYFFGVKARIHAHAITYGLGVYILGQFLVNGMVWINGIKQWSWIELLVRPAYLSPLKEHMYALVRLDTIDINPVLTGEEKREQLRSRIIFALRGDDTGA